MFKNIKTAEDLAQEQLTQTKTKLESLIQSHLDEQAKSLGYDNMNSIAKYLVAGNPFEVECTKLSVWCGNIWVKASEILAEVEAGNRPVPTEQELITELPVYEG